MKSKKTPKANLNNYSLTFLLIGLVSILFLSWRAIELKTYEEAVDIGTLNLQGDDEDETLEVNVEDIKLPPPPQQVAPPEEIEVVEDEEDVKEDVIASTETDDEEEIADVEDTETEEIEDTDVEVAFQFIQNPPIFPGCEGKKGTKALKDCMSKNQANNQYNNYNSVIFDENPYLFREYIASKKHLDLINTFYFHEYNDENIKSVAFEKFFSFSKNINEKIDLNYADVEVLMLLFNTTKERAEEIYALPRPFYTLKDLKLEEGEKAALSKFKTSFFEPEIHIEIEIVREKVTSKISFDYNIRSKKGSDFVFDI